MQNISIIGSERSLFINSDGCLGVVCVGTNQRITCATCRFGKTDCVHVKHLSDICNDSKLDLPETLQEYAQLLSVTPFISLEKYPDYSCLSKQNIPFDVTLDMSTILKMPVGVRFNMTSSVHELVPRTTSVACPQCQECSWSDPFFHFESTIVTHNQLLPAKGT